MRLSVEFLRQIGLFRAAHARAGRATALRHEAWDHAMEGDAVVKSFARQFLDPRNMVWRKVGAKLDDNVAAVEAEGECFVGHISVLWLPGDVGRCTRRCDARWKAKIIAF